MKSYTDLLNEVDYSFKGYTPSIESLAFINFIKEVNKGSSDSNKSPLSHLNLIDTIFSKTKKNAVCCHRGFAKALALDTKILTPDGYTTMRDIQVGDIVYDREGKETIVTNKSEIFTNQCYEITVSFNHFRFKFIANEDHLHIVTRDNKGNNEDVLTTKEIYEFFNQISYKRHRLFIPKLSKDPRYLLRKSYKHKESYASITNIVKLDYEVKTQCISVSSETKSYLIENLYITHNTSLLGEYLVLYIACFNTLPNFGRVNVAMYVANSMEKGVKDLRNNIEARYSNSEFLQKMIPNKKIRITGSTDKYDNIPLSSNDMNDLNSSGIKFTDVRLEFVNIKNIPFVVRGFGITKGVRGFKEYAERPTLCILDDILTDEDARSDIVLEKVEDTIYKSIQYALHPTKQKIIYIGTPFNSRDPLYKAIESGSWKVNLFPVCEKFPCTKEEFRGSWEDRFPYEYVQEMYEDSKKNGKLDSFNQEIMLRVVSEEDLLIKRDQLQILDSKHLIEPRPDVYNYYITTDFASSEKTSADYRVISVWAYTHNKDFILVDGYISQDPVSDMINNLFRLVQKYNPMEVGIEVTGQQGGFVSWIRDQQVSKNVYFNINEIRPTSDKFGRFVLFSPNFHAKKMFISKFMEDTEYFRELEDELFKTTKKGFKSKHDDVLDTISMLQYLELFAPSQQEYIEEKPNIIIDSFDRMIINEEKNDIIRNNVIF